jgi:hypothetical protein
MAFDDLWAHQYCLTCDKQVQMDGAAYCSEACRLAEAEKFSTPSSQASSPGFSPPAYPWTSSTTSPSKPSQTKFYLSPAYDFSNAQPYGSTPVPQSFFSANYSMATERTKPTGTRSLTPSSSHASLCSIQSTSSSGDSNQLSDKSRKELLAYAVSFEQVRMGRRRSY